MKIFLDTASLKEIREGLSLGVIDGITTNPSLLAKEKSDGELAMPLYEYQCQSCGAAFEAYVRSWNQAPACPSCGSGTVERQISSFALMGVADSPGPSAAGACGCGRGGCGCH